MHEFCIELLMLTCKSKETNTSVNNKYCLVVVTTLYQPAIMDLLVAETIKPKTTPQWVSNMYACVDKFN